MGGVRVCRAGHDRAGLAWSGEQRQPVTSERVHTMEAGFGHWIRGWMHANERQLGRACLARLECFFCSQGESGMAARVVWAAEACVVLAMVCFACLSAVYPASNCM